MSSEPSTEPLPPTDPAALPLFAAPPARPGRVRGDFSLRPAVTGPAALDEARRRRAAVRREPANAATTGDGAATLIDWELVRAFRTVVAGRLTAGLGGDWRHESADDDPDMPRRAADMDRDEQEGSWTETSRLYDRHLWKGPVPTVRNRSPIEGRPARRGKKGKGAGRERERERERERDREKERAGGAKPEMPAFKPLKAFEAEAPTETSGETAPAAAPESAPSSGEQANSGD